MAKRTLEPMFWALFGGGGMIAAFVTPVMILITGILVPFGAPLEGLSYENMHAFASNWLGKLILLGVLALPLWHAAHRLFHTLHDLGIHSHLLFFRLATYGGALLGSIIAVVLLLSI
jgi:fumarate reductase subunit D